jgi:hypothetical protein
LAELEERAVFGFADEVAERVYVVDLPERPVEDLLEKDIGIIAG